MRREDQEAAVHAQGKMVAQRVLGQYVYVVWGRRPAIRLYELRGTKKVPAGEATPSPQPLGLLLLVESGIVHTRSVV
jgi:hypothetical protein